MTSNSASPQDFFINVLAVVHQIPVGNVATYGQVAQLAGFKNYARHVGRALSVSSDEDLPWHRVINSQGFISSRGTFGSEELQRLLLEEEGIEFGLHGKISLKQFQWTPQEE